MTDSTIEKTTFSSMGGSGELSATLRRQFDRSIELAVVLTKSLRGWLVFLNQDSSVIVSSSGSDRKTPPDFDQFFQDHPIARTKDFNFQDFTAEYLAPVKDSSPTELYSFPIKEKEQTLAVLCLEFAAGTNFKGRSDRAFVLLMDQMEECLLDYKQTNPSRYTEWFNDFIEDAPDIIFELDGEGRFTYVNKTIKKHTGFDPDDLIGNYFTNYVVESHLESVFNFYIQSVKEKREQSYFEYPVKTVQGKELWIGQTVRMYFDKNGYMFMARSVARDITKRKQTFIKLEKSQTKLDRYSSSLNLFNEISSTSELSIEQQIENALKLVVQYLGLQHGIVNVIKGNDCTLAFIHTIARDRYQKGMHVPLDTTFCSLAMSESEVVSLSDIGNSDLKDHPCCHFMGIQSYIASPYYVGNELRGTVNFTSEKPYLNGFDEYDRSFVSFFAKWVGYRIYQQEALDKIRAISRSKQEFLNTMSHEIRTPMNAILGATELLLNSHLSADQMENTLLLKYSGENLLVLINDILDIAKVDSGKLTLEERAFQLLNVCKNALAMIELKAKEKGVEIKLDYAPDVHALFMGDSVRLGQILINLLGNAVKFTSHGYVKLSIYEVQDHGAYSDLKFEVEDTGIGIPKERLPLIFKSFVQATPETSRKFGGTGLGLTIVQKLLEAMGTTIQVDSQPGRGTTFSFTLTLPKSDDTTVLYTSSKAETENILPIRGISILLVEDNRANQLILKKILHANGVDCHLAESGEKALDCCNEQKFDLILMDIQLPFKDGYETSREIRQQTLNKDTPIIALTADIAADTYAKAQASSIEEVVIKPTKSAELLNKIAKYTSGEVESIHPPEEAKTPVNQQGATSEPDPFFDFRSSVKNGIRIQFADETDEEYIHELKSEFLKLYTDLQNLLQSLDGVEINTLRSAKHKVKSINLMIGAEALDIALKKLIEAKSLEVPTITHQVNKALELIKIILSELDK